LPEVEQVWLNTKVGSKFFRGEEGEERKKERDDVA